jgi:membrane protein YqaA with SNARE-associated domain
MEPIDIAIFLFNWKYLGAFLLNLIASSSVLFPVPFYLAYLYLAAVLSPIPLAIFSALGSTIGEFVSYIVGYHGRKLLGLKSRFYKLGKNWFKRFGGLAIFIFAATPLPDDIIGLVAGAVKYSKSKFFIFCFLGKLVMFLLLAFAVKYSYLGILQFFHLA